ncbi:MAG TPA: epoxide hydrolase [Blastocatellia bacterium]|nr:epoxide hydrolase [Blastocatellia bacterium]
MSPKTFQIKVRQETLDDLRARLAQTRWVDALEGAGWDGGTDITYLKELCAYWQNEFDWRGQEEYLNSFNHFRAEVDGFGIHFILERGRRENSLPLLLTHGWPDSFIRFHKIIPMLTDPANHGGSAEDSFDVVVPSIPGYGFSDRPKAKGMETQRIANLFAGLMTGELGCKKFAAHGGDWGSGITEQLALNHADSVVGIHLTDVPYHHLFTVQSKYLSEAERKYLAAGRKWQMEEGAYAMIQGTRPQTLACGLNDSPAGLAAWIIEKFRAWSDCGGDVESRFTKDELLTNLTIYWATETIHSSVRLYYEAMRNPPPNAAERVTVPTGVAIPPKDIVPAPREFAERFYNLRHWTELPRGGHFAALEEPELLVEDIRAFFRPLRSAVRK